MFPKEEQMFCGRRLIKTKQINEERRKKYVYGMSLLSLYVKLSG